MIAMQDSDLEVHCVIADSMEEAIKIWPERQKGLFKYKGKDIKIIRMWDITAVEIAERNAEQTGHS